MSLVATTKSTSLPRVLVVDDEITITETISDVMSAGVQCNIVVAHSVDAAQKAIRDNDPFDLLLTDLQLPDGDGMSLLPALQQSAPTASAIVITGAPTVDKAIAALRHGAADFVAKPFTSLMLVERVQAALKRQSIVVQQERKLDRLKVAVRKLNEARKVVSKKVDLLCNDLVGAYGELSKQLEGVRTQEGFRKYIDNAKDLEQLLCHSMDWLLRQLGYANVAVWLAGEDGEFQLGAYMKYTTPGDAALTDALKRVVIPLAGSDGFVRVNASELQSKMSAAEFRYIEKQTLIAINCTYLGESLASIVFFRDAATPFKDEDADVMQAIAPIFAVSLASVVHDEEHGDEEEADDHGAAQDAIDDDGFKEPPKKGTPPNKKPRDKKPDADWWKRGEAPPF